ncbi:uncharacterized protein LOC118182020 [Stegodyphus dumicola]|uniref:uncharacterized protein LOC118182020 n=1 Tax=Stegodyphus dumicola TaxID=202533 RepID=UPI0015A9C82A|nr:uncharacterized protein LOC118182020 [Stegodyphus dumicola]
MNLKSFWINLDLGQIVAKSNTDPSIYRALALELLNIFYPEPEWLRIFTDGSLLSDGPNAGAGVLFEIFSFYIPMSRGTAYSEFVAIHTVLYQLPCHLKKFIRAVILNDSRSSLLAIVSDKSPVSQDLLDCRYYLRNLASLEKTIVLQWVPAHCDVPGNKKADFLAKKSALIKQNISRPLPFHTVRDLIKRSFKVRAQEDLYHCVSHKS